MLEVAQGPGQQGEVRFTLGESAERGWAGLVGGAVWGRGG